MCNGERHLAYSASLKPPQGPPLGLQEGETWIGRGTFEASLRAQLLCSRRQACFTLTEAGLRIECHGINSLLFVDCHAKNVHGSEATPATELFQLRRGEAVDLADGDRFYFAAMECLLTVVIRQNHIAEISGNVIPPPLQQASEACVKEIEEKLIENEQQVAEVSRALQDPAQDCGTSDPQSKNVPTLCASSCKTVAAFHCLDLTGAREFLAAPKPSVIPTVDSPVSRKCQSESVGNGQEDSDSLGLDAFDCLPLLGVPLRNVQKSLRSISPRRGEEVSDPAAAVDDDNRLNQSYQCRGENLIEEALPNSAVDEVPEVGECVLNAQFPADGEKCRPSCILEDHQTIETNLCSRDRDRGLGVLEDLPNEICASREQREPDDYNLIMSSETVNGQPIENELLLSEPARGLDIFNVRDYRAEPSSVDKAASGILSTSPVSRLMDAIPVRVDLEEHPEVSGRAYEREEDPEVSIAVEDVAWPDGPIEGMESVIVSVSGYEGIDRQNLVKLINKTGAAFTGQLSKANTHLVCWKFHGKKFDRAMKLHKPIINHQWFEDSLRAGKRLAESPYKLRSGVEVGLLKWKEKLSPLVLEQDPPSNTAISQHRINHCTFFSSTIDQEDERGKRAECAASEQKDLPGTSRQAASGRTGGRKKSRKLVKLSADQGNLVRESPTVPPTGTGESYLKTIGDTASTSEVGYHNTRRKSDSSRLHDAGQVHGLYKKRRNSASSILNRCIHDQGRGAIDKSSGRNRSRYSAGTDRDFTVVNLTDDVDEGMTERGLQMPQLLSAPVTDGINADLDRGKDPDSSQLSQCDREVACAICLEKANSRSEGLLGCGHKFCFICIFTWTREKEKGPSCPLCKASIDFITRREVDSSGKLDETVVVVGKKEMGSSSGSQRTIVVDAVCILCGNVDAESMLMRCGNCENRVIHTFCLDPPAPPPWYCPACTQNHHRDSMRLAWNQFLPGSTATNVDPEVSLLPSNGRRRNSHPYTYRRPSRPVSAYRSTLHAELTQSMGPVRRTNVVGQHSLRTWLNNETSNGNT